MEKTQALLLCALLMCVLGLEARPQVLGTKSTSSYHNSNLNVQDSPTFGSQASFGTGSLRHSPYSAGLHQQPAFSSNGFGTHLMGTGSTFGMPFNTAPSFMERNHHSGPFSDMSGLNFQGRPFGLGNDFGASPFQNFHPSNHRTTSGPMVSKDVFGNNLSKH